MFNKFSAFVKKNRVVVAFALGMIFTAATANTTGGEWFYESTHAAMGAFSDHFFES